MISRKSAKLIADAYNAHYQGTKITRYRSGQIAYDIKGNDIYNFFYEQDYEPWFLSIIGSSTGNSIQLIKVLMGIHTGETLFKVTTDWKPEQRQNLGQRLLKKLAEDIFKLYESIPVQKVDLSRARNPNEERLLRAVAGVHRPAAEILDNLKSQLEIDGYIYRDGVLYASESSVIDEAEEQNFLTMLFKKLALADEAVILNHLNLSEEHYLGEKWGDSITNSRNFLEAILDKVARALHSKKGLTTNPPDRPFKVRDFLEQQGFIDATEKEAIARVYGLISNTGSHPNSAEKDQARLMRHLALTLSQFILLRFEGYQKNNP
jgi:hypothetical protein